MTITYLPPFHNFNEMMSKCPKAKKETRELFFIDVAKQIVDANMNMRTIAGEFSEEDGESDDV